LIGRRCAPPLNRGDAPTRGSRRIGATALARRVLGPLARPITRLQPPQASASTLAIARAADPPPR